MINTLAPNDFIRNDTRDLVDFAEMGIYPCDYCKNGERPGCAMLCRAWPIWFSKRWQELQKEFGVR